MRGIKHLTFPKKGDIIKRKETMMVIVDDLYQGWETLDEAIKYFLELILTLHNLKRSANPPTDLFTYVTIDGETLSDEQTDGVAVALESLS